MANQTYINKCKDVLNTVFNYINNQPASFFLYQPIEYPASRFILDSLCENFKKYPPNFPCRVVLDNRKFAKKCKNIFFNFIPDNRNIYDASYQFNTLNNIYTTIKYRSDILEVFFSYHYTNIKEAQDDVSSAIAQVIYERFNNVVKFK